MSSSSSSSSSARLPSYSATRQWAATLAARAEDALPAAAAPRFLRQPSFADDDLHSACRIGDLNKIRRYLDRKPEIIMARDMYGNIPLYYACLCGHISAVNLLLERGAYDNDNDRCWLNALDLPIRHRLREYEGEHPELYPYSKVKPKRGTAANAAAAASSASSSSSAASLPAAAPPASGVPFDPRDLGPDPFLHPPRLLFAMRQRLDTDDIERFHAELVDMLRDFSDVLHAVSATPSLRKESKNVLILKHLAGTATGLDMEAPNGLAPAGSVPFLHFLLLKLKQFRSRPGLVNDGLRILALLCAGHPANLDAFAVRWKGLEFLDEFIDQFSTGKATDATSHSPSSLSLSSSSSAAPPSAASSLVSISGPAAGPDDPEFVLHFLQTLVHLVGKPRTPHTSQQCGQRWQHLLPFLCRTLRSFLDFPPIAAAVLQILKSLIEGGSVQEHYDFLLYQGIQLCVAAYLAYVRLDRLPEDSADDDDEEDQLEAAGQAMARTEIRGLDEDDAPARPPPPVSAASCPSSAASPGSQQQSPPAAGVVEMSREERATRTQVSRLSMQLLSKWVHLPRSEEESLSRFAPSQPPAEIPSHDNASSARGSAQAAYPSASTQLREAYAFLRSSALTPNPLTDVGMDYAAWFAQPLLADVVFTFDDEAPVFAHKIVLCARCEYWRLFFCGSSGSGHAGFSLLGGAPPRSRQVSSASVGGDGGDTLVTSIHIASYRRATFLLFLEYLYVGLNARGLRTLAETSLVNGAIIDAQLVERAKLERDVAQLHEQMAEYRARGQIIPSYLSSDPRLHAPRIRIAWASNVADYIELLRIADEYAATQLRIFVEYLIYDASVDRTHLISVDTVWRLLAAALAFHAPMLELHCLRFLVAKFDADDERELVQARGFKKQRTSVLSGYGFMQQQQQQHPQE